MKKANNSAVSGATVSEHHPVHFFKNQVTVIVNVDIGANGLMSRKLSHTNT